MRASRPSLWRILGRLSAAGLLTPGALTAFAVTAIGGGVNLASLLRFAARRRGGATALNDAGELTSFNDLAAQCERMAAGLRDAHGVRRGDVVAVLAHNGAGLVRAVFAASRLGARVTLLNPEMSAPQLAALIERHHPRLVITGPETRSLVAVGAALTADALLEAAPADYRRLAPVNGGELVVLTGGTTGPPKAASRKPSPRSFALLFVHLVTALGLDRHPSAYLAVPLFHGYGIAAYLVALTLGRTVYLVPRFKAAEACALIQRERIEVVAVVPSMLQRMLAEPGADLSSLACVICGGAALPAQVAIETRKRLGDVLFNLYGTSEAGVAIFAAPSDLAAAPDTIGRPIWGVHVTIRDDADAPLPDGQLGRICVDSSAAVKPGAWIETGDVGLRDRQGLLFVRGRIDDMIVSGGENVAPWEVETVLATHPQVREAAAVGVPDPDFGQRLVAFVVPAAGGELTPEALSAWLAERVARYQRPRSIEFRTELPLTAVGKIDKRALAASQIIRTDAQPADGRT
jgi:acyl-CoA synthetase (AMP-forming)/AMP-acid ligase II